MTAGKKQLFTTAFLLAVLSLPTEPLLAHVEEGHMPDAVAEVEYKILLEFKPRDFKTRTKLAHVLIRQGKLDDAENELDKAAAGTKNDPEVFGGYIVLRLKQNKVAEALEVAEKSIQNIPNAPILYLHYGNALLANGQSDEARKTYLLGLDKITGTKDDHEREQLEEAIKKTGPAQIQLTKQVVKK